MSLSAASIKRPVLASVMSIIIIIFGVLGFSFLGVREYPVTDPPIVNVQTSYPGANAQVIEAQITEPIEEQLNGIPGIKSLTSTSLEGRSNIKVEFELGMDLEAATNDVRDKVSSAQRRLPKDCDPPVVRKADGDADPIVFLNMSSEKRSLLDLSYYAESVMKERLQTIPDVAEVQIWGFKQYAMRLWMDPDKMAAYGLTALDVYDALQTANVELPSGKVEGMTTEFAVKTQGRLSSPEEFNDLILFEDETGVIRFGDVGTAEYGPQSEVAVLKRDGVPMVGLVLIPQPGANAIEIVDEFYNRLETIEKIIPEDLKLDIGFDKTKFIRRSIGEVQESIYFALALVALIIFAFLRDWRSTVIPLTTIPISLIGTFFMMYILGFSINVLTLLAMVLAIGLVVDDTIVVLENIYTKIENGMPPLQAGLKGSGEIFFAVVSTTVALVSVFLPIIFLDGMIGQLFREFGLVLAGSVIISSFVALTFTPMACTKLLKKKQNPGWFYTKTEPLFLKLNDWYARSLNAFMRYRWQAFPILILSIVGLVWLNGEIQQELSPLEDRDTFRVSSTAMEGATFEYMDDYIDRVEEAVREEVPEENLRGIVSMASSAYGSGSVNQGWARVYLKPSDERPDDQRDLARKVATKLYTMSGAKSFVQQDPSIKISGGGGKNDVNFVLQATSIEDMVDKLPDFMDELNGREEFSYTDINLRFNKPEIHLSINREKAMNMGVSVRDIASTLQLALSGQRYDYFLMKGRQYEIIGQIMREKRSSPTDVRSLYVRSQKTGELIQLDNVVHLKETSMPPKLYRYNRAISATVSANMAEGYTMGDGLEIMEDIARQTLDERFTTSLAGSSQEFKESMRNLQFALLFAIILIYLVLSAQFESFIDPLIILLTVPLAIVGALFAIWYCGQTLNIFSQIGIIMLVGLVTKNAILIVEFANQRKEEGIPFYEAIVGGATARFRPVLMTVLSTVLGIIPIAVATGAGAESRQAMGISVIGGMLFASILTLYLIPAFYSYFSKKRNKTAEALKALEQEEMEMKA
ncbi:efflux RND transporter permease subunit [Persicobacter sp. CCB-QB2]|uniref:efflux RND transporter permease subunit n=1 Tax=Persicobacter sp. CCB-QB2 TaxID=1561025 RepID=UPI0006A9F4FE|nr:efflux RND transporter permease subunit [Persicobacter sp. CCB-QB2]